MSLPSEQSLLLLYDTHLRLDHSFPVALKVRLHERVNGYYPLVTRLRNVRKPIAYDAN
jgi:hypothetical protein